MSLIPPRTVAIWIGTKPSASIRSPDQGKIVLYPEQRDVQRRNHTDQDCTRINGRQNQG